jgi:hypothetical protein
MNIGVDIRTLSFRKGGISHFTYGLLKALTRLDRVNRYWLFNFTKSPYEWDTFRGNVQEIVLRLPQRLGLKRMWESFLLPLAASKYDLQAWFSPDFLAPRFLRIPRVVTIHDLIFMNFYDPKSKESLQLAAKVAYAVRHAAKIIVTSQFTLQDLRKVFAFEEAKMAVVPLAADERFHPIRDQELVSAVLGKYGVDFPYILFVGETSERKNVASLLKAYRLLKDANRLCGQKLLIVGKRTGYTDRLLREVSTLELADEVFFTGYVPDEDLPFIYNGADVFVFPSLYEGFGIPPIEAMQCQIPVVASKTTSIPEVVGEGALLFDPRDPADIANTIDAIINAKVDINGLKSMAKRQAEKFNWTHTAKQTMDILNSLQP